MLQGFGASKHRGCREVAVSCLAKGWPGDYAMVILVMLIPENT